MIILEYLYFVNNFLKFYYYFLKIPVGDFIETATIDRSYQLLLILF